MSESDVMEEMTFKEEPTDWATSCLITEDLKPNTFQLNEALKNEVIADLFGAHNEWVELDSQDAEAFRGTSIHSGFDVIKPDCTSVPSPSGSTKDVDSEEYAVQQDSAGFIEEGDGFSEKLSVQEEHDVKRQSINSHNFKSATQQFAGRSDSVDKLGATALKDNRGRRSASRARNLAPVLTQQSCVGPNGSTSPCTSNLTLKQRDLLLSKNSFHRNNNSGEDGRRKRDQRAVVCVQCNKSFSSQVKLKTHLRSHSDSKRFACGACPKSFSTNKSLKIHLFKHSNKLPYACADCGKEFSQKYCLSIHLRTHSKERPYKCELCNRSYSHRPSLVTHQRSHSGQRPYACDHCEKAFYDKTSLNTHNRTHTDERPYACDDCGKSFRRSGHLKTHLLLHSGELPHKCDECEKGFTTRSQLTVHLRNHFADQLLSCHECGRRFKRKYRLVRHMSLHFGESPHACQQCGKAFARKSSLSKHNCTRSLGKACGTRKL